MKSFLNKCQNSLTLIYGYLFLNFFMLTRSIPALMVQAVGFHICLQVAKKRGESKPYVYLAYLATFGLFLVIPISFWRGDYWSVVITGLLATYLWAQREFPWQKK